MTEQKKRDPIGYGASPLAVLTELAPLLNQFYESGGVLLKPTLEQLSILNYCVWVNKHDLT